MKEEQKGDVIQTQIQDKCIQEEKIQRRLPAGIHKWQVRGGEHTSLAGWGLHSSEGLKVQRGEQLVELS